ncbi:hypothetical protein Q1695_013808 [Nippostrongylus brasiliensis]|nr:hypothetical protein Q1695_013808 [Nippostrongylus brasiliensis]
MRLILFVLLLALTVNGGFLDGFKNLLGDGKNLGQKLKNATIVGFHKLFNNTAFLNVREKLKNLKAKVRKTLELTPELMKSLKERLKKLRLIKKDVINPAGDSVDEVNEHANIAEELFQGDIVLTEEQADEIVADVEEEISGSNRTKRQAFKDGRYPSTTWSKGVNYYFASWASPKMKSAFIKGAKQWQDDTCIDFKEDKDATDRIFVFPEDGCWSYVGRLGNEQKLSLGNGCESVSTAAHEIGHALGFYHTMSRHDRDNHITVVTSNIKPDWLDQFTKQTVSTNDNYGLKYDNGGIMHYGGRSASKNGGYTMVPFDTNYQETLGSPFISFIELSMMNEHYGCKKRCATSKTPCKNGGFPHPRNCNRCICPSGYGGPLCDRRPDGCGETLKASEKWESLEATVGDGYDVREDFDKCNYWIESPAGTRIEVKIVSFNKGLATDGCIYGGVEVNSQEDQQLTGYRFCAPEDAGTTLRSYSNRVPIMIYNRAYRTDVELQYRFVRGNDPRPVGPSVVNPTRPFVSEIKIRPSVAIRPSVTITCRDEPICDSFRMIDICKKMSVEMLRQTCPKRCKLC